MELEWYVIGDNIERTNLTREILEEIKISTILVSLIVDFIFLVIYSIIML